MPLLSKGEREAGLPVWRLNRVLAILQHRLETISKEAKRETPIVWSTAHMYSTTQLAKITALQRGLNPEIAGLVSAFHDVHTLHTGQYKDHGPMALGYIQEIVKEYNDNWGIRFGEITEAEVALIYQAIKGHSDKRIISDEPYSELLRDVDSLDSFLHGFEPREGSARAKRVGRMLTEFNVEKQLNELKGES